LQGTVRSNLDPFSECTDDELWHSLEMVHMKEAVQVGVWVRGV
jgi:ABC-type multidrug transport system fused ATPase/permease subunit